MSPRLFLPRHHRTHEEGGSDEIRDRNRFGSWSQHIPLYYFDSVDAPPNIDFLTFDWATDSAYRGCGYCGATANGSYFSWLVNLSPRGSVWHVYINAAGDVDYGKLTISFGSLVYESTERGSGELSGKIGPADASYPGSLPAFTYVDLATIDCYESGGFTENSTGGSSYPFIVGGVTGTPLTDFTTGITDPVTGFTLMDGGPGWYRMRVKVDGKNGASSGYKARVTDVRVVRKADDNAP